MVPFLLQVQSQSADVGASLLPDVNRQRCLQTKWVLCCCAQAGRDPGWKDCCTRQLCSPWMLLICLGMVLPRVAAWLSLCSSGRFAARCFMHELSITAGIWHLQKVCKSCFSHEEGRLVSQLWACVPDHA